jgi:hypothetical protein
VSHEYRPGKSDVNFALVLTDTSIPVVRECLPVQKRWMRRGVAAPFYLTPAAIKSLSDVFPVEFLTMRQSYRILYGDDVLAEINLHTDDLRRQCLRELSGLVLQLKREFGRYGADPVKLGNIMETTIRRLLPVFKAVLVLYDRKVPSAKAEIIAAVEDQFGLGASVFSELCNETAVRIRGKRVAEHYDLFTRTVEAVAGHVGRASSSAIVAPTVGHNMLITT